MGNRFLILLPLGLFCLSLVALERNTNATASNGFASIIESKIYYHQQGTGGTPVIFVSGLGEDYTTWRAVQDKVANFALTLTYDRAGLGRSEYHEEKKDLSSMTKELHDLVVSVKVHTPFILVGHSLGCQIAKEYAVLYPQEVQALVLLDPGFNELKLKRIVPDAVWKAREEKLKKYLPPMNPAQQLEMSNLNLICEQADQLVTPLKIPVVLFTATKISPGFPGSTNEVQVKTATHELWLRSLPNAVHKTVAESRHYIQNDFPEMVVDEISILSKAGGVK
ncbi:MAG: alpha/beta hydrolase [Verrucomicrobiota bacterium]